jgi:hypothetical protein
MRIIKVAPIERTSGIDAELSSPIRLDVDKKFGLKMRIKMHNATRTATGAHLRQRVKNGAASTDVRLIAEFIPCYKKTAGRRLPGRTITPNL